MRGSEDGILYLSNGPTSVNYESTSTITHNSVLHAHVTSQQKHDK